MKKTFKGCCQLLLIAVALGTCALGGGQAATGRTTHGNMYALRYAASFSLVELPAGQKARVNLPEATVIPVTLDKALSSATNRVGDRFTVTVRSAQNGDAEFPLGTRISGSVTEVQRTGNGKPGMLALHFIEVMLPDGQQVRADGSPISLDEKKVTQTSDGRLVAKSKKGSDDSMKFIAIGAGGGLILGKLTDHTLEGVLLGAAAGYFYGQSQKTEAQTTDVTVAEGAVFGVRLDSQLTYDTNRSYITARNNYRQVTPSTVSALAQDISVTMDGRTLGFGDDPPFQVGGIVLVSLASVMEQAQIRYNYDEPRQTVSVGTDEGALSLTIGNPYALLDGNRENLEAPAQVRNGQVFAPLHFLTLATGMPVVWDAKARTVTMTSSDKFLSYPQGSSTGSIIRIDTGLNELTIQGSGGSQTIRMDQPARITRREIGRASQIVALSDLGMGDDVLLTRNSDDGNAQTVDATYRSVSGTIKSLSSSRLTLQPNTSYDVAGNAVFTDARGNEIPRNNLRTGQQVTVRLNPTSNEVWEISQGALKTPLITSITHSGITDLRSGDVFNVTVAAPAGGYAKFDLEGIATGVRMTESGTRGTYTGKLTIPNRSLPNQSRVVVTFQSADGRRETRSANELGGSGSTYSTYQFAAPVISSPRDGDEIGNTITVRGRTEPNAKVSIELFYQRRGSTGKGGHKGPVVVIADQYGDFETKPIALKASPSLKNTIDGTLRITATLPDGTKSEEAVVKVVRSVQTEG